MRGVALNPRGTAVLHRDQYAAGVRTIMRTGGVHYLLHRGNDYNLEKNGRPRPPAGTIGSSRLWHNPLPAPDAPTARGRRWMESFRTGRVPPRPRRWLRLPSPSLRTAWAGVFFPV